MGTVPFCNIQSIKGWVFVKKKIDEYQIYEKHYEEIYNQVKNDPYAQSLGIQLKKFEAHDYNRERLFNNSSRFCFSANGAGSRPEKAHVIRSMRVRVKS